MSKYIPFTEANKGKRYVFDLETNGLLDHNLIDYTKVPYQLKPTATLHCAVFEDIDTGEVHKCYLDSTDRAKDLLLEADVIIGHNIIAFDLLFMRLYYGVDFKVNWDQNGCDEVGGKPCRIIDTLVLSKLLNPDRGGHSLKDWGKRLKNLKGDYGEQEAAWEEFSEDMLKYCVQDVNLNVDVLWSLVDEMGWHEGDTSWKPENWQKGFHLEQSMKWLVSLTEHYGFRFNKSLAESAVTELNQFMEERELKVEPKLPPKPLSKSNMHVFPARPFDVSGKISATGWNHLKKLGFKVEEEEVPQHKAMYRFKSEEVEVECRELLESYPEGAPKKPFKKDGSLATASWKYLQRNLFEVEEYVEATYKTVYSVSKDKLEECRHALINKVMPPQTEPMTLSNQAEIKKHLVELGWVPTVWGERDITMTSDKKLKLTDEQYRAAVERYIRETVGTPYETYRVDHLFEKEKWYDSEDWFLIAPRQRMIRLWSFMLRHDRTRPLKVITSPKYVKNADKELCDGLERVADKVPYAKDIVEWLTYRHRRNSILSPNGTGWLTEPRIDIDGVIPTPADTCGCSTSRFQHRVVANVPRPSSVYGHTMRGLFMPHEGHLQIGFDGDALEARVQGHFIIKFGGQAEADLLVAPKPYDCHSTLANDVDITRDEAKTMRYLLTYGGQPARLAKSLGFPMKRAKQLYKQFWELNPATKRYMESIEAEWERNNRSWLVGIDGRKLRTRAKHALMNTVFQSTGVINMKFSHVWLAEKLLEEGFNYDPFAGEVDAGLMIFYHDEGQGSVKREYFTDWKSFDSKDEAEEFVNTQAKRYSDIFKKNGKYWVTYCRPGELASMSFEAAGEHFGMHTPITGGFMVGDSWATCH